MRAALFRKQMLESFAWVYRNPKSGKNRTGASFVLYLLLFLFVFVVLGGMCYMMAVSLCEPLVQMGLGWLYFAIMGLMGLVLGVFACVFNTAESLFHAKDNDLLLSMPIPTGHILTMRLSGVYALGLLYELVVMVPALIVWFLVRTPSVTGVVFSLLVVVLLSVFVLTLACVLGWAVSLVSGRVKNKSFVTVVLTLVFLGVYYVVYFQAYTILMKILTNASAIADAVAVSWNPLYHMGLAAQGEVLPMLYFTAIVAVLFAAVYWVLRRSFLKIATTNRGTIKSKGKKTVIKAGSVGSALFRKELGRFTASATYMMNTGLGIVFMLVIAAALVIKQDVVREVAFGMLEGMERLLPLAAAAAICFLASMNDISAPSVSLEGKSLWVIQVLPVTGWQVLKAKLKLHLVLNAVPGAVLVAAVGYVLRFDLAGWILVPVTAGLFVTLMGALGLCMNLKMPNLNWTNEAAPVKQSLPVTIALFGGWVIVIALGALYVAVAAWIQPMVYLLLADGILLGCGVLLLLWLKHRGARILETL